MFLKMILLTPKIERNVELAIKLLVVVVDVEAAAVVLVVVMEVVVK